MLNCNCLWIEWRGAFFYRWKESLLRNLWSLNGMMVIWRFAYLWNQDQCGEPKDEGKTRRKTRKVPPTRVYVLNYCTGVLECKFKNVNRRSQMPDHATCRISTTLDGHATCARWALSHLTSVYFASRTRGPPCTFFLSMAKTGSLLRCSSLKQTWAEFCPTTWNRWQISSWKGLRSIKHQGYVISNSVCMVLFLCIW